QHPTWENIVGGNFALIVRVPHESKASLTGGRVRDRARGRSCTRGAYRADSCIGTKVWAAPEPGTIRQNVRVGQSRWTATCYVAERDRKSTRLNSSHGSISYAVFCLKKKKKYEHFFTHEPLVDSSL